MPKGPLSPEHAAVGVWIREQRRRSRLSQAELCAKVGISQQVLSYMERGGSDYSLLRMRDLAAALGADLGPLLRPAGQGGFEEPGPAPYEAARTREAELRDAAAELRQALDDCLRRLDTLESDGARRPQRKRPTSKR